MIFEALWGGIKAGKLFWEFAIPLFGWLEEQERLERRRKRNNAIIRCLIYSAIIGVLYYYGFTDSFFEWIYNWWNG
jgi:hypothetical protein